MAEKQVERMQRMINKPLNIRNICTSAHIHHGKTAFTDNLLAAAGLMAEKAAGDLDKGMATWQHADEQERLLTVDAANVSMVHSYQEQEYLINLIDTPGHVDFGGNVTRAMRAIDGTIVLVCASEGIMPQTETVLRQALRERVKPVLFINKVDRLVKEMQFTSEKIQERITKIIIEFNRLVEQIAEKDYGEKWKVNILDGSVAFGSARDNWALSLPYMKKKNISFKDILNTYSMTEEERKKWMWDNAPLYEVILDMVIKHLPNPLEAQKYRIPKIWHGDHESELGKSMLNCDPNGKLSFCITRVLMDPRSGREVAAGRLYSGTITEGMEVYLNLSKSKQKIQNVYMYLGIKTEPFSSVPAGNVLAVTGLNGFAGETITTEPEQPFEELKHIFEPVITKSISPVKAVDLPKVVEVLRVVGKEDPSIKIEINDETGENLMSGMGELHLEIIENRIRTEKGVEIKTSAPIVVYRETITRLSTDIVEGKSPNKHNKFYFKVEPLEESLYHAIKEGKIPGGRAAKKKSDALRESLVDAGMDSKEAVKVKDVYKGNIFADETRGQVHLIEVIDMILDMFEDVMSQGPLAREPCLRVKVTLVDMKLHEDAIHRGPAQVYPAIRDGIRGAMMLARPVMFEPLQIMSLEAPVEYMGELSKIVTSKRGQLLDMHQEGHMTIVKAKLPVAELIGWASELRSATEGRASSSLVDQMFEKVPEELQQKVRDSIVKRKGLTEAMLGA
jgi:elongation factor 2